MSAMPQRTRVLIKDLLFQEKYKLTNTQIDIMSYIFNSQTWAVNLPTLLVKLDRVGLPLWKVL